MSGWIDVSQARPDFWEDVLIAYIDELTGESIVSVGYCTPRNGWRHTDTTDIVQPTHWMPLPRPPGS